MRLEKSMAWRKENKIDSILDSPEMKKMAKNLKFSVDSVDKHGHPVLDFNPGAWDVRKTVLSGRYKEFRLFWVYMYESALQRARELSATTGNDISEFVIVLDITGFNARSHTCLACKSG